MSTTVNPRAVTKKNVRNFVVDATGKQGWYIFRIMIDAEASTLSVMRALRRYRPGLARPTVQHWRDVYKPQSDSHNRA